MPQFGGRCYQHLMFRTQGYTYTFYNAQDRPIHEKSIQSKMSRVQKLSSTKLKYLWQCSSMMLSNWGTGEDSWESLGQQGDQTSQS